MVDGIHTLPNGHNDRTANVTSICDGSELFLGSFDEAKSKSLHPSQAIDPTMIQPQAPMRSIGQTRSHVLLDKAKKWIIERMTGEQRPESKDGGEYSSDEIRTLTHI